MTQITRRELLTAGTVVVVAAGVPLRLALAESEFAAKGLPHRPPTLVPNIDRVAYLGIGRFQSQVGTRFRIQTQLRRATRARLVSVTDLAPRAAHGECFRLLFRTRVHQRIAEQGTYGVSHPQLGRFALFLVPMEEERRVAYCEAVVNRLDG